MVVVTTPPTYWSSCWGRGTASAAAWQNISTLRVLITRLNKEIRKEPCWWLLTFLENTTGILHTMWNGNKVGIFENILQFSLCMHVFNKQVSWAFCAQHGKIMKLIYLKTFWLHIHVFDKYVLRQLRRQALPWTLHQWKEIELLLPPGNMMIQCD